MKSIEERLQNKSAPPDPNGCIKWLGYIQPNGYGQIGWKGTMKRTHRVAWEVTNGPIPKGLEIDHICRNRSCLNVDHLRVVTHAENMRGAAGRSQRKRGYVTTHCPLGHEYSEKNTYWHREKRYCRECNRLSKLKSRTPSQTQTDDPSQPVASLT